MTGRTLGGGPRRKREPLGDPEARGKQGAILLRAGDQRVLALLLSALLLLVVGSWWARGGMAGRLVDFDRAARWDYQFQIDLNEAQWPELALLPGIGETLARRIVAHRERRGPFTEVNQLQQVRGIGPKTLKRIRPYFAALPPGSEQPPGTGH